MSKQCLYSFVLVSFVILVAEYESSKRPKDIINNKDDTNSNTIDRNIGISGIPLSSSL